MEYFLLPVGQLEEPT